MSWRGGRPLTALELKLRLAVATLVGLALRCHALSRESLWADEGRTLGYVDQGWLGVPLTLAEHSVHPPFYFVLMQPWIAVFGTSEAALRFPSAAFGAASIPLVALVGERLYGRRAGWLAALLLTFAPFHVFHSQNGRPYALLGLLTLAGVWTYLEVLRESRPRTRVLFLVTNILLLYTHVFGAFVVAAQGAHFLWTRRPSSAVAKPAALSVKTWFQLQLVLLLSYSLWVGALVGQAQQTNRFSWLPPVDGALVLSTMRNWSSHHDGVALALFVPPVLMLIIQLVDRRDSAGAGPWLLMAGPLLCAVVVSWLYAPIFHPRYGMTSFVMLVVIGGAALERVHRRVPHVATLVALIALGSGLADYYAHARRPPWRDALAHVGAATPPGTPVVYLPGHLDRVVEIYLPEGHQAVSPAQDSSSGAWSWPSLSRAERLALAETDEVAVVIQSSGIGSQDATKALHELTAELFPQHRLREQRVLGRITMGLLTRGGTS